MCPRYRQSLLILLVLTVGMPISPTAAHAGIVTTTQLLEAREVVADHDRLQELLERDDVRKALSEQGVDPSTVQARVDSMTNAEIQTLAAEMDRLPAGGRLSTVELLLIIIIIILLI